MRIRSLIAIVIATALSLGVVAGPQSPASAGRKPTPTPTPLVTPTPASTPTPAPTPMATPAATPPPPATPTPSSEPESSGSPVQYTASYWQQLALVPSGFSWSWCELYLYLNGLTGVCSAILDPVWLHPDGAWRRCPWVADPTVATGWVEVACQTDPGEGF